MIVGTWNQYDIGQRYVDTVTTHDKVRHPDTPFVVLRVATEAEWLEYLASVGVKPTNRNRQDAYFYEVSVD